MDYGIGMVLAGLISGAGTGWYSALMKERAAHGDPKERQRQLMYYKSVLHKADLSAEGDKVD